MGGDEGMAIAAGDESGEDQTLGSPPAALAHGRMAFFWKWCHKGCARYALNWVERA